MITEFPGGTDTLFEWLDRRQLNKDVKGIVSLLSRVSEANRVALAPLVEARIKAIKGDGWWSPSGPSPSPAGLGLIVIGTAPSAARAAALLGRRGMREGWGNIPRPLLLDLVRARQMPWLGDLAGRLAEKLNPQNAEWSGEWGFADALLRESGTMPPVNEAVARGWLGDLTRTWHRTTPTPLVDKLRDSPYLDLLLPTFFEIDGLGAVAGDGDWDPATNALDRSNHISRALAQLAAEGRLDRTMLLEGTLDRLLRGDKPNSLRTFTALHEALDPTPDELADHALDYARLLPDAASPIAGLAQRALHTVDDAGRLELETLLEASAGVLLRKEKVLVKAQLTRLEKVARREPDRRAEILDTVALAFGHPALDIQERALNLIAKQVPKLGPDDVARLADQAVALGGDLPDRAARLFGTEAPDTDPLAATLSPPPPPPPPPPVAEMPPPIASAAELAEEIVTLVQPSRESAAGWERVLAALVTLHAAGDRAALADALKPVLDRHAEAFVENTWIRRPRFVFLGEAIRTVISDRSDHDGKIWQKMVAAVREAWTDGLAAQRGGAADSPYGVLSLRVSELSIKLRREPVPVLLATPTHVTGSLDAEVLLARLSRAETEGWTPWPFDLDQALARVPRTVDPEVVARASALTSKEGKAFAEMLRSGGVPDPIATRVEQLGTNSRNPQWGEIPRRVVVRLEPSAPTGLLLERRLLHLARDLYPTYASMEITDIWSMTLPHHRDAVAAWGLPALAGLADMDEKGGAEILPVLAECDGPIGPGMSYAVAYVLGARHEADRLAAVDAILTLAARGEPFAAGVGAALGDLGVDGTVKLSRVVPALGDVHRAGGTIVLWELLAVALPLLVPAAPRGLPDLLELSAQVALAAGARGVFAELEAVAGQSGSSRLVRESKRLRDVLNR